MVALEHNYASDIVILPVMISHKQLQKKIDVICILGKHGGKVIKVVQGDIGNMIAVCFNDKHFRGHYIKPVKGAKCEIQLIRLQKKTSFALCRTSGVMTSIE